MKNRELSGLVGVALLVSAALFGCNQILGIQGATLEDGDDSDDSDVSSDTDSSSDDPSTDDADGSTGGGSNPGNSVQVVPGSCADGLELDTALVIGCVNRISCDPLSTGYSISDCITYGEQARTNFESCTTDAETCVDVENCIGRGLVDRDLACGESTGWSCLGSGAINCPASGAPYLVDCLSVGSSCNATLTSDTGAYAFAGCVVDPTVSDAYTVCSGAVSDPDVRHCDATTNTLYACIDGVPRGFDCTLTDSTCFEDTPGSAGCTTISDACDSPGNWGCNSESELHICYSWGRGAEYTCGPGTTCVEEAAGSANCLATGCTPDDSCTEGCNGTTLELCLGKAPITVDCEALGYTGCFEGESLSYCSGPTTGGGTSGGGTPVDCDEEPEDPSCDACCASDVTDICGLGENDSCDCPDAAWDINDCFSAVPPGG